MYTRFSKTLLIVSIAFCISLIVFNNINDYASNFVFVKHVLQMDTTFPGNHGMWRAIDAPIMHHLALVFITVMESLSALLCWLGAWHLYRNINDPARFNKSKGLAISGLMVGLMLWFTIFIGIGGEWFLMWQSKSWNAIQAAFRLVVILGGALILVVFPDSENQS